MECANCKSDSLVTTKQGGKRVCLNCGVTVDIESDGTQKVDLSGLDEIVEKAVDRALEKHEATRKGGTDDEKNEWNK